MAKKSTEIKDAVLIKDKAVFEKELQARIEEGQQLLKTKINSEDDMPKLQQEFVFWHNYNAELIKNSFNIPDSNYYEEYTYVAPISLPIYGGSPTRLPMKSLHQKAVDYYNHIQGYINRIITLKQRVAVMKTDNKISSKQTDPMIALTNIFTKFHRVAQLLRDRYKDRDTIVLNDEYDVQDLLEPLLYLHFDDIRKEDYSPSHSGANSIIDFILKAEKIGIEVKMTSSKLTDKKLGEQLGVDITRYEAHPDCKTLVIFVYDKGDHIRNKKSIVRDLEAKSTENLKIRVFITPE